jgi:O-antigen/teichoic acid export membrane protein
MAEVSYAWCLALMVLSALATLPVVLHYWLAGDLTRAYTVLAVGLIVTLSWPTQFLTVTYRTSAEFGRMAARNTVVAVIGAPLTLLVMVFGYLGLIARAVLLAALAVVALHYKRPMRVQPAWDRGVLMQLGKVGMPIWMLGQFGVFFLTLDRIVLADSPLSLGYYSIAVQASTFAGMIPTAITMVMYPQMVQKYGESHNAIAVWNTARRGAMAAVGLGAVAALCGWLLVPYFIAYLVPAYQPGTRAAQWACLTGVAMGLSVYNNVFNVIQRQDIYLISWLVGLAVFFASWYGLIHFLSQVDTVAAIQSMLLAILLMSVAALLLSRIACLQHDRRRAAVMAELAT